MEDTHGMSNTKEAERLLASREGFVSCSYVSVGRPAHESRRRIDMI